MSESCISIVVFLKDGRAIDITHMDPEAAIDHLRTLGVTSDEIAATVHRVRLDAPEARPAHD